MIELKNINKDYVTSSTTVHALKDISLAFRENEFVAVLGQSGGGKTTLLNIVGGLDKYTSGDLVINGKSTKNYKDADWDTYRNHSVGFIFQSYNLIPHQTVLSNVELALTIAGVDSKERKEKAIEVLNKVGLSEHIYKKPNQLSGGQMQRVAIARALINDPDILLADEPTGALDSKTSIQIMDLLKEVAKDKLVVMVTHNPELAEQYATRIVRIADGEIIGDSNPYQEEESHRQNKTGRAKMRITTALSLSLQNLWTKKARTILVGFAGSIGIIGIALILALSNGVNDYIADVQENSLSSYPLTIENSTVDFTTAMTAMMGSIEARQEVEGSVSEVPVMTDMFASIDVGENNLKALKNHLDLNKETISPWVSCIQYSYGISLNIYKEKEDELLKVNPSELMSSSMMSMYSAYSFSNTFFERLDNQELLDSQYEVLAGKWGNGYDELVLVLADKYAISDFTLYSLGLKDSAEFEKILEAAMKGESSGIQSNPLTISYEDLLKLEYKLVLSCDYYKYEEGHNAWINESDDEEYVKELVKNGLTLKIVGVVAPKSGVSSTALSQGLAYNHSLIEWAINQSAKSDIVKSQLASPEIDVFSGSTFEDINNKEVDTSLDFSSLISIDEAKLKSAFGGNYDAAAMQNMVTSYVNSAMNAVVVNDSELYNAVLSDFSAKAEDMVAKYISASGSLMPALNQSEIDGIVDNYMNSADLSAVTTPFGIDRSYIAPFYSTMLKAALQGYYTYTSSISIGSPRISNTLFDTYFLIFIGTDEVKQGIQTYCTTITEAVIKAKVGAAIGGLSASLISEMSKAMQVDTDAIASAFTFNMSEDDITRLMTSMNSTSTASLSRNLKKLGYHELDDPTSIYVYLYNFEGKDNFKDFIADYNKACEEAGQDENVISYTDITGILMSSVQDIINAVSYVLIAFVSVSLVVSSIMIGIITYISVIERTKEIGVLRSLGASKRDVGNIFSAETFIIGLLAGLIGVSITALLCIPINIIIRKLTNIASLNANLPLGAAIILVILSVILTLIAGIFPSGKASKCDPVIALRTE